MKPVEQIQHDQFNTLQVNKTSYVHEQSLKKKPPSYNNNKKTIVGERQRNDEKTN